MRRTLIAIGVTLIVAACTRAEGEPSRAPTAFADPAAEASQVPETASPSPSSAPATLEPLPSDPELRHIVELRRSAGLRADLEWIAAVAADPRATTFLLAIPLLPEEEADVIARGEDADAVGQAVREYASAHADEFGGLYIDQESGAGVVTLWTGHLAEHEAAIRARTAPRSRVDFRLARYSEAYLRSLQDRISSDVDWMTELPAQWQSVGVDVINNRTLLTVSSANPNAVALIEEHFDVGDALVVESDGTGAALVPWGWIAGSVRTAGGEVPGPADYYLRWRSSDLRQCGVGDVAYGLAPDGTFKLPCQAGTWTIEVTVPSGNGWRPIGEGTVDVSASRTVRLDIVLSEEP
jgi:hypothetical protein